MDGWPELDRFLRTDPRDVGCAQAREMLHIYAEMAAVGGPVEQLYPGIAAHLRLRPVRRRLRRAAGRPRRASAGGVPTLRGQIPARSTLGNASVPRPPTAEFPYLSAPRPAELPALADLFGLREHRPE
jgi:hypothetical protein